MNWLDGGMALLGQSVLQYWLWIGDNVNFVILRQKFDESCACMHVHASHSTAALCFVPCALCSHHHHIMTVQLETPLPACESSRLASYSYDPIRWEWRRWWTVHSLEMATVVDGAFAGNGDGGGRCIRWEWRRGWWAVHSLFQATSAEMHVSSHPWPSGTLTGVATSHKLGWIEFHKPRYGANFLATVINIPRIAPLTSAVFAFEVHTYNVCMQHARCAHKCLCPGRMYSPPQLRSPFRKFKAACVGGALVTGAQAAPVCRPLRYICWRRRTRGRRARGPRRCGAAGADRD